MAMASLAPLLAPLVLLLAAPSVQRAAGASPYPAISQYCVVQSDDRTDEQLSMQAKLVEINRRLCGEDEACTYLEDPVDSDTPPYATPHTWHRHLAPPARHGRAHPHCGAVPLSVPCRRSLSLARRWPVRRPVNGAACACEPTRPHVAPWNRDPCAVGGGAGVVSG